MAIETRRFVRTVFFALILFATGYGPEELAGRIRYKTVFDSTLIDGARLKKYRFSFGSRKTFVYAAAIRMDSSVGVETVLPGGKIGELGSLLELVARFDSSNAFRKSLVAANANFWSAYSNRPINLAVCDGEILEMKKHKNWRSIFFGDKNEAYIDEFNLTGEILFDSSVSYLISSVNRRTSDSGVALYNRFVGDTVPKINKKALLLAFRKALADTIFVDSTEIELDSSLFLKKLARKAAISDLEFSLPKIAVIYLEKPAINKSVACLTVDFKENGVLSVPRDGAVVSFGDGFDCENLPKPGDLITLEFKTDKKSDKAFYQAVGAAPVLVKRGRARVRPRKEGIRSRRFIYRRLPRTGIGISHDGKTVYLFATAAGYGASLSQWAYIARKIGCWNALNLDGGSSTTFIANGENLARGNKNLARNVAVGILFYKKISSQ